MASNDQELQIGLFEPVSPPRFPISATDQGGYAFVAALLIVLISGLVVLVKLQMAASTFRKLRRDDYALTGALIFLVLRTIAICLSVEHGLGRAAEALNDTQTAALSKWYLAAQVFLYLSLACSKCAIALLVIAIQPTRWITISLYTIAGTSAVWAIAAVVTTIIQCGPTRWVMGPTGNDTCIDQFAAQIGIHIVDILTDVLLALLPGVMMMGVQVTKSKRAVVGFMFGLRIITPVFTALSLSAQADYYAAPTRDRPFEAITPSVWTSIAVGMSLVTACLPSIKRFLMDWAAGVSNNMVGDTSDYVHSSSGKSRPAQASGLRSFTRSRLGGSHMRPDDGTQYSTYAHGGSQEGNQIVDDGDSKKGLTEGIMQTTDVHVRYDGHH